MPVNNIQTLVIILLFAAGYLFHTLRKTAKQQIDLYDLVMLSTVAIVPALFVLFPVAAERLTHLTGVAFPFVILFGTLLAVLFVFIHRMTVKLHRLENDNRLLIQELSLLKQTVDQHHHSDTP